MAAPAIVVGAARGWCSSKRTPVFLRCIHGLCDGDEGIVVDPAPRSTLLDDAMKGIGAGIGKSAVTPQHVQQQMPVLPPVDPGAMKVALDGNRIVVSAVVGLKDAKRLLKRLEANIALLEEEESENGNGEAAN